MLPLDLQSDKYLQSDMLRLRYVPGDLALKIKACDKGDIIDDDSIGILLYPDDIVLFADNETELQNMLDILITTGVWLTICL